MKKRILALLLALSMLLSMTSGVLAEETLPTEETVVEKITAPAETEEAEVIQETEESEIPEVAEETEVTGETEIPDVTEAPIEPEETLPPTVNEIAGSALTWVINGEGTLTVSGEGLMPDFAEGNRPWEQYIANIRAVVAEEGVMSIGAAAFSGCANLEKVSLPSTLLYVGDDAFKDCAKLTEVKGDEPSVGAGNEALTALLATAEEEATEEPAEVATEEPDAAQQVVALIDAIGEVTIDSEAAITAAQEAYEALSDDEKANVTNYDVLEAAMAAYEALNSDALTAENEAADFTLNLVVNSNYKITNGTPQKAVLGDDGILRVENRSASLSRIWLNTAEGVSVSSFEVFQGLRSSASVPGISAASVNNVLDGVAYTSYCSSSYFKIPFVGRVTLSAADGSSKSYYIIVSAGSASGSYAVAGNGFSASDDTIYNAETGISFSEAGTQVTLTPNTQCIGSGDARSLTWTWSTSDKTVATVKDGVVTSVGGGSAVIKADCDKISITCNVTSAAEKHSTHTYVDGSCSVCGTDEPSTVRSYFTINDENGKAVLSKIAQTVSDVDCDGTVTIKDAFLTAHIDYCESGADGFVAVDSAYGPYITRLWGVDTSNVGYYLNKKSADGLLVKLNYNADLVAFFYRDTTDYSDLYTYFDSETAAAVAGKDKAFTIKAANDVFPAGANVTVYDSNSKAVKALATSVASDGSFTIKFTKAGEYVVEVSGTANYTGSVWDYETSSYVAKEFTDAPITPSSMSVTVYEPASATVYVTASDKSGAFIVGKNGDEICHYPITAEDDPENPDGVVSLLEICAALHEQQYPDGLDGFKATTSWVSRFWGDGSGNLGYYLNDVYMSGSGSKTGTNGRTFVDRLMATAVEDGDSFKIFLYQDMHWSDQYTYFKFTDKGATVGIPKTFTAYATSWGREAAPEGALITTYKDGELLADLATFVDADGHFTITFPEKGVYTVELSNGESKYFVPSRMTVTVGDPATKITLNKSKITVLQNNSITLKATVTPKTVLDKDVSWTSENPEIATVDENGVVKAVGIGKTTITATAQGSDGKSASCTVTVKNNPIKKITLAYNDTAAKKLTFNVEDDKDKVFRLVSTVYPATASDPAVVFTSSNPDVAAITDETTGKFVIGSIGKAVITCTSASSKKVKATCTINVTKVAVKKVVLSYFYSPIPSSGLTFVYNDVKGQVISGLKATVQPTNATYKGVTWTSSNENVVTVDAETGAFTVVGAGKATIKCKSTDNKKVYGSCKINVTKTAVKGITVMHGKETLTSKSVLTMKRFATDKTLSVTFNPTDASFRDLTWKSSNTKVVMVDANGVLTAKGRGTATITVTSKDNSKAKLSFKVKVTQ